jgi:hypothetical protein
MPQFSIKQVLGVLFLSSVAFFAYSEYSKWAGYRYMAQTDELGVDYLSDEEQGFVALEMVGPDLYLLPKFNEEIEIRIHTATSHLDWNGENEKGSGMELFVLLKRNGSKLSVAPSIFADHFTDPPERDAYAPNSRVPHRFRLSWDATIDGDSIVFTLLINMYKAGRTVGQQEFRLTTITVAPSLD